MTLVELIKGIHQGEIKKNSTYDYFMSLGFKQMKVDINAAPFDIHNRYAVQDVVIPEKKRGNLSKFAGKKVEIVVTTIAQGGPQIWFWIKIAE